MASLASTSASPWLRTRRWDLTWLVGTALIVPFVLSFVWSGVDGQWIGLGVTALVGGPHLFSTFLGTYLDPGFRRAHRALLVAVSIAIPSFVIWMAIHHFQLLLSVFIFAASIHVLHQNAYLAELYRARRGRPEPWWSRWLDTAMLMLSMYPIAAYKLVHRDFWLSNMPVLIPERLRTPATYWTVGAVFAMCLVAWIAKTIFEHRRGELHAPKTILLAVTAFVAFAAPCAAARERMELAFQSVNAWHSVQYLAIVWLVLAARAEQGKVRSPLLSALAGPKHTWRLYGACFGTSLLLFVVVKVVARANPIGLTSGQYYYIGMLSALLTHYALDAYLFAVSARRGTSEEEVPYATPARPSYELAPAAIVEAA